MDNEFILQDRIQKIQQVIKEYGEENFYLSFSGGMDSTVLSFLIDLSLPGNKIPRVFVDTNIELNVIKEFVMNLKEHDNRIVVINSGVNIRKMLEKNGYPFKSKEHSLYVDVFQRLGYTKTTERYLNPSEKENLLVVHKN